MKILVADDSKTNLALIKASLERLSHEVITASGGEEALQLFKEISPDLVILDVVMGGMSGFECATKIRAYNPDDWIPIIFLSASVDDASIAAGINAGGDDYLAKPFSEVTLEAKINAMQRISEMRKKLFATTEELKILSSTDVLTGLYNRFQFEKSLRERLAAADRHQHHMALMFIDLDHFKTINDSLGHQVGDLLLKETAVRLKSCLRIDDFIARIGGDEFVIILSDVESTQNITEVAKKTIQMLSQSFFIEENTLKVTASVGIAIYPSRGITHESIVQGADVAMYHAKGLGRNNFQFYSEDLGNTYRKQINLEHELKFALEKSELFISYQPIYHLITKKLVGMEALLRWKHPEFGIISPSIFVRLAEETGLIMSIGEWAFKQICAQGAKWFHQGYNDFKLSINISLQQLLQENFFDMTYAILKETQFPTRNLELELTEATLITYNHQLLRTIHKFNEVGISISIDDFGSRYSTLNSLRSMPISTLKINKDFLKDVAVDQKNGIIVRSLIALGNNLNLNVIAKGIQFDDQVQFLILNGCYLGQGFLFSKPLTVSEMENLLKKEKQPKAELMTS